MQSSALPLFTYLPESRAGSFVRRFGHRLQLALKVAVLVVCTVIVFGGHYPPAQAQHRQTEILVPVLTVKDAQQDDKLEEIDKHLEATDAHVAKQGDAITNTASDVSGLKGEERGIGVLLGLLSIVQIFIQVRARRED